MTSMLLTPNSVVLDLVMAVRACSRRRAPIRALRLHTHGTGSAFETRGRDVLLSCVLASRFFHHLVHHRAVAAHPFGHTLPLRAGPLLKAHQSAAAVIAAGRLDRRHHRVEAELL